MVFSSIVFLYYYLPIVFLIYMFVKPRYRNSWLFIANLIFYGWKEPVFILIMLFSTVLDYFLGKKVYQNRETKHKGRRYVFYSVIINLGMLSFFKYYDFIALTINQITNQQILSILHIPLPIGISFYTFQTMSYTIDIYRKDAKPSQSIIDFGTYVTLFPQLIAGPIVRYKDIALQLENRHIDFNSLYEGINRFTIGLAKKVLIANNIGYLWNQIAQLPPSNLTMLTSWIGIFAFAFQIYFDFSGYSDMAIGLGKMFGFTFLENFNYPYISKSITEFWRRWHISLGIWFRDYVYIPLGGNRKGKFRTYMNIASVWILTGIWHGASWNYLFWGIYFGLIIMIEKMFLLKLLSKSHVALQHIYTIFLILIGWVLFAFEDMLIGLQYLKGLFNWSHLFDGNSLFILRNYGFILILCFLFSTPLVRNFFIKKERELVYAIPILVFTALIICTAYLVDSSFNPFLYFRF